MEQIIKRKIKKRSGSIENESRSIKTIKLMNQDVEEILVLKDKLRVSF